MVSLVTGLAPLQLCVAMVTRLLALPQLHYLRLPKDSGEDHVILMDSTVSTGAAAMMAVRVLLVGGDGPGPREAPRRGPREAPRRGPREAPRTGPHVPHAGAPGKPHAGAPWSPRYHIKLVLIGSKVAI